MRTALLGLSALAVTILVGAAPAGAQYWTGSGTWCIQPPVGGGIWRCSFYSYAQCEATRRGAYSGNCVRSPAAEWDRREGKAKDKRRPGGR
jgi:hypothetical protein